MKKIFIEYISIIGYIITGLVFALTCFILFINFYHSKEIANEFVKSDEFVDVYTKNKLKFDKVKETISKFDANNYRGDAEQLLLMNIKSKLEMCITKYENTDANKILSKKKVNIQDVYELMNYYQSDIVNDCITLQIYSININDNAVRTKSFNSIKPFINVTSKMLMNDLDYLRRVLQNNSSYHFGSDYDKTNIFNITRDSYTKIEASYQNSVELLFLVSEWFDGIIGGNI